MDHTPQASATQYFQASLRPSHLTCPLKGYPHLAQAKSKTSRLTSQSEEKLLFPTDQIAMHRPLGQMTLTGGNNPKYHEIILPSESVFQIFINFDTFSFIVSSNLMMLEEANLNTDVQLTGIA